MGTVGRFAPSPSGRIHLGNILCCMLAWLSARQKDGRVILRIEDLDTARCPRRYADQMEEDLRWLGLDWDEGPTAGGPDGPYYQSQRTEIYQSGCPGKAGSPGAGLSLLLHPGGAARRQRTPPGGWTGGLCRHLPPPDAGGDRGKDGAKKPGPAAGGAR